ncbi:hypothetical protein FRC07_015027 [Ceratobasidium sp. 392]|nr:hypothetical protein FRC07_015027 [Ceratobasidium sp. 392]
MVDTVDSPPLFAETLAEPRLPDYSRNPAVRPPARLVEHRFSLSSSGRRSWLTLRLQSYASSSQAVPLFHQGNLGIIRGEVSIDAAELNKIKSVTVVLCGERTVVGQDKSPSFLDLRTELWNATTKKPSGPWAFELELPRDVHVKEFGASREIYELPPSFSVKTVPSFLEYRLIVEVKRGRFRLNSELDTTIIYVPKGLSPELPTAHFTALTNNLDLPTLSNSDWVIGSVMNVHGTLFGARPITVKTSIVGLSGSTLAIGTFAPVLIVLECADNQALDLFSTPSSIQLRLVQEVYIGTDTDRHSSHNTFTTSLGRARVWPTAHPAEVLPPNTRLVEGELVIPRSTRPSFEFARFEAKYRIQLRFDCPGFVWNESVSLPSGVTKPTLETEVKLVSDPGSNVAWKSRVPPVYAGQDLKDEDFYDDQNVTGILLGAVSEDDITLAQPKKTSFLIVPAPTPVAL